MRLLSESEVERLQTEEAEVYLSSLQELERSLDLEDKANGLTSNLQDFFRQAWEIVEPHTPLVWSWVYEYLCEWLEMVSNGEFKKRYPAQKGIIINVPPRTAKSSFVSIIWPCWTWILSPHTRFLCASYSGKLSVDHNQKRRALLMSRWYQERFGERFLITTDRQDQLANDKTGYFVASSVGGSSTGFGGSICIADDLLSRDERYSPTTKTATNLWIDGSFDKLLNTRTTSVFVHVSQRLGDDDPTGHLLGEDDPTPAASIRRKQWVHVKVKREATEEEIIVGPQSGKVIFERKIGDILQPERNPPHVIAELKLVAREWSSQEQQEPAPSGGVIFQTEWWNLYKRTTPLPNFDMVVVSVDASFKDRKTSDPVAIHKIGIGPQRRMLLNRHTEVMSYTTTKAAIKAAIRQEEVPWCSTPLPPATILLIEDKANGSAIIDELSRDPEINCTIIAIPGNEGKTARALAASADVNAGLVWLPEDAEWYAVFQKMFAHWSGEGSIPHDDDIDALCQALNWARNRFGKLTLGSIYGDAWSEELLYPTEGVGIPEGLRSVNAQVLRFVSVNYSTAGMQVLLDCIDDGKTVWIDREFIYDARAEMKQKGDAEHVADLKKFMEAAPNAQAILPIDCGSFADEATNRAVWHTLAEEDKGGRGIRLSAGMMKNRTLRINRACTTLVQQIPLARWDAAKKEKGVDEASVGNDEAVQAMQRLVNTKIPSWRLSV